MAALVGWAFWGLALGVGYGLMFNGDVERTARWVLATIVGLCAISFAIWG